MCNAGLTVEIENEPNWLTKSLGNLCRLISRGTAPVYVENSEVLAIGQRCVASTGFAPEFARPHSHRVMSNVLEPESGDVLLNSTGTGTIGRSVVFNSPGTFIVDGHVTVMRPRAELADSRWLNSMLRTPALQRHLERFCFSGSTNQVELSRTPLAASQIPTPHIVEQQRIAQVLDTIDTAIHETEAIIAKLMAVKQGLLHDLLTRGINANGELRPTQTEAPHLYKESPLGWIPKEWNAIQLAKLVSDAYRYPNYYDITYVETGVAEVRGECVRQDGTLAVSGGGYRYISENTASRFPRVRLTPGDIVMTVRGTIGKFALVPDWLEGAVITANLLKFRPNMSTVEPDWLLHVLLSSAFQDRLDAACSATTIKTIQVPALLGLRIATPSKNEQQEITLRLAGLYQRLSLESKNLEKLQLNKTGLMDDLLTGRVRVTPLLDEAAQHDGSA